VVGSRPTLLIVDNCEHVLDDVAALVAAVKAGAPTATVLATSQEPLGMPGEVVLTECVYARSRQRTSHVTGPPRLR
jgi:predicted ATPase